MVGKKSGKNRTLSRSGEKSENSVSSQENTKFYLKVSE